MTTLLKDLIDIPLHAGANDYVLKLTDGVEDQARTLRDYVVTPELTKAFDKALAIISSAIAEGSSKASYLDGSFGSGKSHFMAVLYSILGGNPGARGIPELAPVIAENDKALSASKILTLAYHFVGADTVEDVILGGYVDQIRRMHPGCTLPAVHETDLILADADDARRREGDDNFFARISRAVIAGDDDEWGEVLGAGSWDAASYDSARNAAEGDRRRTELVSAYLDVYSRHSTGLERNYRPLPQGLAAVSDHAKELGYDAVVLFCDEIILWLTFMVSNHEKFSREVQKITQLVETGAGHRAVPIISFLARQLNLQQFFSDNAGVAGNEQQALETAFRHQEGRFARVELGEHNLPLVVHKRLLSPKNGDAARIISQELERLARNQDVKDVLLDSVNADENHRGSTLDSFRLTYPFAPALISTLQELSGVMQRDRTALKVMQRLLVEQRDTLTVDSIIPVGDLFDILMDGGNPINNAAAAKFANAQRLYETKFQPLLAREHKLAASVQPNEMPLDHPYRADARLAKTLVLSALAPNVPAFANITPARIAALNHGTIKSPLEKRVPALMLGKLRTWQTDVPELRIPADSTNPVIRLGLSEVDYESVLLAARSEDTGGRRRELLRDLICESFGIDSRTQTVSQTFDQKRLWRGTERSISLLFANVCDTSWIADSQFEAPAGQWLYIIDYPFDDSGKTHRDDLERVVGVQERIPSTNTLVWLPKFFSQKRLEDLGRLVVCNYVLQSDQRWRTYTTQLNETDRAEARRLIETQRDALLERIKHTVNGAYGITEAAPGSLVADATHEQYLKSLNPSVTMQKPAGTSMAQAFANIVESSFDALYPGHPRYAKQWRPVDFATAADNMRRAAQDADGRHTLLRPEREATSNIVNALKVGHVSETDIVLTHQHFDKWSGVFAVNMGRNNLSERDNVEVKQARLWIEDAPPPSGLTKLSMDLIILGWALLNERSFYRGGQLVSPPPAPGLLSDDMILVRESLPSKENWAAAVDRAGSIFNIVANHYMTPTAVNELVNQLRFAAKEHTEHSKRLVLALQDAYVRLGLEAGERLEIAQAAMDLLESIGKYESRVDVIDELATARTPHSAEAMGKSITTADDLTSRLGRLDWEDISLAVKSSAENDEIDAIMRKFATALETNEIATHLSHAIADAASDVSAWIRARIAKPRPPVVEPPSPLPSSKSRSFSAILSTEQRDQALADIRDFMTEHHGQSVSIIVKVDE
ncbi:hypothetical protein M8J71_01185 [Pseudarthrobacter sp. R1]|uniref:hypothetical protein n=1 Tax=Pseudarthrobacter sp. R1 TaxID=2944934 RepID=UPI00210B1D1B|nr:hypothetical protein [Pseudarthrobacter sp. R1]MCQ6269121.1 hypothetical protein [Pseudarthrobacter sp. R1]